MYFSPISVESQCDTVLVCLLLDTLIFSNRIKPLFVTFLSVAAPGDRDTGIVQETCFKFLF